MQISGNSLEVQWLGLPALTAAGLGLIPGQETKIPQTTQRGQRKKCKVSKEILEKLSYLRLTKVFQRMETSRRLVKIISLYKVEQRDSSSK